MQPKRQRYDNSIVKSDINKTALGQYLPYIHILYNFLFKKEIFHKMHIQTTAMWFLTSRRRLLSLTPVPSGKLSLPGSGLEDAVLMVCFLEVFSGFTIKNKNKTVNGLEQGIYLCGNNKLVVKMVTMVMRCCCENEKSSRKQRRKSLMFMNCIQALTCAEICCVQDLESIIEHPSHRSNS